jgi:hypothetical protein
MTLQLAALIAALIAAVALAAGLAARLAYEHHALRAAALAFLWIAARGHGRHNRAFTRPRPSRWISHTRRTA